MKTMNKLILLGIDANLSPPAQHALRFASNFLAQSSPDICLVLLHVIPVPSSLSFSWGMSSPAIRTFTPVTQQRMQAEHALWKARTALKQQGVTPERIAWLQRVGTPADEIVKAARELGVDRIVIGSRGNTLTHRIGRVLMGSTSRRVMHHAPCPVTLVVPPGKQLARSLVAWYKEAAALALEQLASDGLLYCQKVKGEWRYLND
jgi:nucleotide-binding universal stress UspA family protein